MSLDKKRWIILVASCLVNLCIGSTYSWSVFAGPMAEHFSSLSGAAYTASSLSLVFTICNAVGPITMITGGWFNDKFGPKKIVLIGGIMFALGIFGSSFAGSLSGLILSHGILAGLGLGFVYGCTVSNAVKFFPDKRGLIGGIATASYGISSVIVPTIANALILKTGVLWAFRILGVVYLIVICVSAIFIEQCPPGYVPAGYTPPKLSGAKKTDYNWKQMMSTPVFYVMICMLLCGAVSGMMMISAASPMAQTIVGVLPTTAAVLVSILSLFNALGRVLAGLLSDKFGQLNTISVVFPLMLVGLLILYFTQSGQVLLFASGLALIGLCFGAFMGIFPGFTADQFGPKNNSVNYGIMFIGFAVAGLVGPNIISVVLRLTDAYTFAFVIAGIITLIGFALSFLCKQLQRSKKAHK